MCQVKVDSQRPETVTSLLHKRIITEGLEKAASKLRSYKILWGAKVKKTLFIVTGSAAVWIIIYFAVSTTTFCTAKKYMLCIITTEADKGKSFHVHTASFPYSSLTKDDFCSNQSYIRGTFSSDVTHSGKFTCPHTNPGLESCGFGQPSPGMRSFCCVVSDLTILDNQAWP